MRVYFGIYECKKCHNLSLGTLLFALYFFGKSVKTHQIFIISFDLNQKFDLYLKLKRARKHGMKKNQSVITLVCLVILHLIGMNNCIAQKTEEQRGLFERASENVQ